VPIIRRLRTDGIGLPEKGRSFGSGIRFDAHSIRPSFSARRFASLISTIWRAWFRLKRRLLVWPPTAPM